MPAKKAILISIHHVHAERILDGLKTLEIRKSHPSSPGDYPYRVYMYETQSTGSGLVVGEFLCKGTAKTNCFDPVVDCLYIPGVESKADKYAKIIAERACLSIDELTDYTRQSKAKPGTRSIVAWDVSEPVRYKTPLYLVQFGLYAPPQSWCYVEPKETGG